MKHIIQVLFFIYSMGVQANETAVLHDLASLEWKNRIILINASYNEENYLALLKKKSAEINDRHIIWFIINENEVLTNFEGKLSENFLNNTLMKYGFTEGRSILIGKDGGIKSQLKFIDLETIFSKIDAMPMRQYEMKN